MTGPADVRASMGARAPLCSLSTSRHTEGALPVLLPSHRAQRERSSPAHSHRAHRGCSPLIRLTLLARGLTLRPPKHRLDEPWTDSSSIREEEEGIRERSGRSTLASHAAYWPRD